MSRTNGEQRATNKTTGEDEESEERERTTAASTSKKPMQASHEPLHALYPPFHLNCHCRSNSLRVFTTDTPRQVH